MPTPAVFLEGKRTDPSVTNIHNTASAHWCRWLGPEHRCLVPFTSFSELDSRPGAPRNHPVWFALGPDLPLAFFAGLCTEWPSVRKLKEGARMRLDLRHRTGANPFDLCPARVHEAEGRGRRAFALFQAARHPGPLVWVLPAHVPDLPMLTGLPQGIGERLHLLRPQGETDLLWCVEESLRATPIALVIAEPEKPLSLTVGRRLPLAAEAGRTTGLMLIRQDAGSNATETRWTCEPQAGPADSTLHGWSLIKNKKGTLGTWVVNWDGASAAFHMVSEAGERHQPQGSPG